MYMELDIRGKTAFHYSKVCIITTQPLSFVLYCMFSTGQQAMDDEVIPDSSSECVTPPNTV